MHGGTRSYEIARRLVSQGHSVTMLTTDRQDFFKKKTGWNITHESGIEVHWLSVPYSNNMGYSKRIFAFIKFIFSSVLHSKNLQPDIIFATSTPLTIAVPGVLISKWKKVPFIFEVRDLWPENPIALKIIKDPISIFLSQRLADFAYNNAKAIVTLSPQMEKGIRVRGVSKHIKTITNGSDTRVFFPDQKKSDFFRKQHNISKKSIVVTYAGTFGLVNGVSYIVQLAEKFKNNSAIVFLLIGNGRERNKVITLAKKLNCLNKNLFWINNLPKEQMPYVLSATDISFSTVIPVKELEANSANKVFDGMASGCCIAINHEGWLKDLLEKNKAGISLSQNIEMAYVQINSLINNTKRLALAKKNARNLAENFFDYDILTKDVLAVMEEILKSK